MRLVPTIFIVATAHCCTLLIYTDLGGVGQVVCVGGTGGGAGVGTGYRVGRIQGTGYRVGRIQGTGFRVGDGAGQESGCGVQGTTS